MTTLLSALRSNPGVYAEVAHIYPAAIFVACVAAVLSALGLIATVICAHKEPDDTSWFPQVFGTVVLAIFVFGFFSFSSLIDGSEQVSAYRSKVTAWLKADYGLEATDSGVRALIGGEQQLAKLDDKSVVVSLITGLDGNIGLVDEHSIPISPRDDR
jgi:hypothetical protein